MKTNKGITLIALIITVIVLLILAGTAVSIAINGGNIFTKANEAKESWNVKVSQEESEINQSLALLDSLNIITETTISKETTGAGFVGCYADVDGDGDIDGVIYADLLVGKPDSGTYGENEYAISYVLPTDVTATNVKDYVVSQTEVTDTRFDNTARDVIKLATNQTGTKDRFYVMGLEDIKYGADDGLYWYYNATDGTSSGGNMTDYATYTSDAFGKGRENTAKMLTKWKNEGYGEKNDRDIWNGIDVETGEANEGWFVPSCGEWCAFGDAFNIYGDVYDEFEENIISAGNYSSFGLYPYYWSSSQNSDKYVWQTEFDEGQVGYYSVNALDTVRLSTTF